MKKLVLSLGMVVALSALVAQEVSAYQFSNSGSVPLKVLVFKTKADADRMDLINKIQAGLGKTLKFVGGKAKDQAAKENANPGWMLANNVTAILNDQNTINLIKEFKKTFLGRLKASHIIKANDTGSWAQGSIRKQKAQAADDTMYALIFSADGTKLYGGGRFKIGSSPKLRVENPGTETEYLDAEGIIK